MRHKDQGHALEQVKTSCYSRVGDQAGSSSMEGKPCCSRPTAASHARYSEKAPNFVEAFERVSTFFRNPADYWKNGSDKRNSEWSFLNRAAMRYHGRKKGSRCLTFTKEKKPFIGKAP